MKMHEYGYDVQMYSNMSMTTLECNHDYFHKSLMNVLILFLP